MSTSDLGMQRTRHSSSYFLLGPLSEIDDLGNKNKLPTKGDVLKSIKCRQLERNNRPLRDVLGCKLQVGKKDFTCKEEGECRSKGNSELKCVVATVRLIWAKAGIPVMSDFAIMQKMIKLEKEWKALDKNKHNGKEGQRVKEELFKGDLEELFDIATKHNAAGGRKTAEDLIRADTSRSADAKEEDIMFLEDQRDEAQCVLGKEDTDYREAVLRKQKRIKSLEERIEQERKERDQQTGPSNILCDSVAESDTDCDEEDDQDYEDVFSLKEKKKVQKRILVDFPKDILHKTAMVAKRHKISPAAHADLVAAVIGKSGGDLEAVTISPASAYRHGRSAVTETASSVRESIKVKVEDKFLVLHFDGKTVEEVTGNRKLKNERIAVVITAPGLEEEQVLGVVIAPSSSGSDQEKVIIPVLQEWGVIQRIIALCCDTTSSNTGKWIGACMLLQKVLGKALLNLLCNHHTFELHIKSVAKAVSARKSKSPKETLFEKLQKNWNSILDQGINYTTLNKLAHSKLAQDLTDRAKEVLEFTEEVLEENVFKRGEYKQLAQLIHMFLGGNVDNFHFATPGAFHRARFMSQALYYLKWALLLKQIGHLLTQREKKEVQEMAKFIALFYGQWWLQSPLASSAPSNCLKAIAQMRQYERVNPVAATACLESLNRHTGYLSEQLVVLAIADRNLNNSEKNDIARKLVTFKKKEEFPPKQQANPKIEDEWWLGEDGKPTKPSLSMFVGEDSWLLFHLLEFSSSDLQWLKEDSSTWSGKPGYQKFASYVDNLAIVNDCSERGVKLIEDFVDAAHTEELRQNIMISVAEERKNMPSMSKKEFVKRYSR